MIFGAQARSNKATILLAGTVIFLFIFVGLVYNHLDYWHSSSSYVDAYPPNRAFSHPPPITAPLRATQELKKNTADKCACRIQEQVARSSDRKLRKFQLRKQRLRQQQVAIHLHQR